MEYQLFFTTVFLGFFTMMNPFAMMPVYVGLVERFKPETRRRIANKACLISFIIMALFVVVGNVIFQMFGITLNAFRLVGGGIMISAGIELLRGHMSKENSPQDDIEREDMSSMDIAVSPLAVPMLAGPGTLAVGMNFAGMYPGWLNSFLIVTIGALVTLMVYLSFIYSEKITNALGRDLLDVIARLMGLIIAVMGVQMIILGSESLLETWGFIHP
ncbi:MarC family protein [Persicobacter sp. CCB-QB2]|uniref:MarC family protein n=1 Tax=Persicobacter sp. CCB-QB2 TaxID=1561025 RepID=UPI0006A95EAF|nr:MarC family protein [Persicobacter sp. CCB-QB2]